MKYINKNLFTHIPHASLLLIFLLLWAGCNRQDTEPAIETPVALPEKQGTIITLGDSLTAGLGVAENDAWPALLEGKLHQNGYNWQVINAGISGETSSGALSRVKWIAAQKPDIVILETGANDGLRGIPTAAITDNISRTVQVLKEANVTVILAGMQIVRNLGAEYTSGFAEIYPLVAKQQQILLIPFLLQDVAGEPSLNQADTIHPNEDGHKIIVETVYPVVLQSIENLR